MNFLYLSSNKMGTGDDDLGKTLLRVFLEKLAQSDVQIDVVGCVNSGIFLTTNGSDVLDSLEALQAKGARIATCGTCLEHYARQDKLLIGEVGAMDQTVQIMALADRVIRP